MLALHYNICKYSI